MADGDAIPHAVLSEIFQERLEGRRLLSAVFLTFRFDPAFLEQQILPVLFDIPASHAEPIRLLQLEDSIRSLPGEIAVYYDPNGLDSSDGQSAKLDVRRIPIRHGTGVFHPKNVLLLVESTTPDEEGHHPRTLVVASQSANLTRAGWWENVECCHVEEIPDGSTSGLRDDLLGFLRRIRRMARVTYEQVALQDMIDFLRRTSPVARRSSMGTLHTRLFSKDTGGSLTDFISEVAGEHVRGAYLEVISPYFDEGPRSAPLEEMIERFEPKEVRVFLPRSDAGEALCPEELFDAIERHPTAHWSTLPKPMLSLGAQNASSSRMVHAKVYRFFRQNPKREIIFLGSFNLTSAAHQRGGNLESGFLVDRAPPRRPEFWLSRDSIQVTGFSPTSDREDTAAGEGTRLRLVHHWDRSTAEAFWDGKTGSGELELVARNGEPVGRIGPLQPQVWTTLPEDLTQSLAGALKHTSLLSVTGDRESPVTLLVQEEGMSHKPSLLFELSAEDILRYWSLLTPAQRAAFVEARAPGSALAGSGSELVAPIETQSMENTLFDRFAGVFHAFSCLERTVREALRQGSTREADYRLFGRKYDSLGSLLDRIDSPGSGHDEVHRYVTLLCALQLTKEIERHHPDYWSERSADTAALRARFTSLGSVRASLLRKNSPDFPPFLDWFEKRFLARSRVAQETAR